MPKFGQKVKYHGADGPELAFVVKDEGSNVVDLVTFSAKDGQSSKQSNVPQRDQGAAAGHNWEPL